MGGKNEEPRRGFFEVKDYINKWFSNLSFIT